MNSKIEKFLELKKKEKKPESRGELESQKYILYEPQHNKSRVNEVEFSKIPKDVLIDAHHQMLNKGVPENQKYYTSNISKATKEKVLEHIKKQKYSMKEFENIVNELYVNKKEESKKGLAKRKQISKEIEEMNRPKINIDKFIFDKQKDIDEGLTKKDIDEGLTKQDLEDLKYWEDKIKINNDKEKEYKSTGKIDGKKVPISKRNSVENEFMNNSINWGRHVREIKFRPELKKIKREIKDAHKAGEITKEERDKIIKGSENSLSNELDLRRRNLEKEKNKKTYDETKSRDVSELKQKIIKETPDDFEEYNKGQEYLDNNDYENAKKIFLKLYKKSIKSPHYKFIIGSYYSGDSSVNEVNKTYKEKNIMKARSDLKKNKDGKYSVDTEMNIKKGLEPKVKKALKKSVILELDKKIEGSGFRKIDLDYSSSEDDKPKKKRGRPPKKGKGLICDSDSDSDSERDDDEIKEYGKILSHLVSHIKDPKEPIDKKDFKQAIELIKKIKTKKT